VINFFDLTVLIITLLMGINGFHEGLLRGAIKLAGFIIIIIFMMVFSEHIIAVAHEIPIFSPKVSICVVFLFILFAGTGIIHIGAYGLHKLIHMTPAGFIDSGLGCAFGILKALLINGVLAVLLSFTTPGTFLRSQYEYSLTAKHLVTFLSESVPLVKKTLIPLYQRFLPVPQNHENIQEHETIPQNFI